MMLSKVILYHLMKKATPLQKKMLTHQMKAMLLMRINPVLVIRYVYYQQSTLPQRKNQKELGTDNTTASTVRKLFYK